MAHSASLGVLLDHVQDKIVVLDDHGEITYANEAVRERLGYEPSALVGENAFDYIHSNDAEAARAAFEGTIDSDTYTTNTVEYRFRAADGDWVWLESKMSNLTDEVLEGYVVSSRDISDRVAAERDGAATAARLEELASVAGDVLWMFSADWSELLFVNPAYETVYGKPVGEVHEDPSSFIRTVHPDDRQQVREAMDCLSSGTPVDMEYRVNPESGYDVWVWVQAEPIQVDGEVARITGFSRDITERKRRERQLFVMDKLLRHNLRNDLTTILGQAELIEETVPETTDRVAVIRRTGENLLASAEKQRDVIDILTSELVVEQRDIVDIVEASVETVRERFPSATVELDGPPAATACVSRQFRLAILELVENAVQHSRRAEPSVTVTVGTTDDGVSVTVADEGPPIPANERQVLTGDYEMHDLYHSTGLGLWLVHWLVDRHHGEVTVTERETGNAVRVALPRPD